LFSRSPNPEELRTKLLQKASVKLQHFYNCCFEIQHTKKGLANGENPYQAPAYLHITDDSVALGMASLNPLSEQIPCYTNLADLDCLLNLVIALAKSFVHHFGKAPHLAVAAKHGNACGCAISWNSPMDALEHALWGNAKGIWGGELVVNFEITPEIAQAMLRSSQREARYGNAAWMLDIVAAPAFTEKAGPMLTARKFRKVFSLPELAAPDKAHLLPAVRCVRGGQLEQPPHDFILQIPPNLGWNDTIKTDMILAWAISFWSFHGGNEVAIVKDSMLLGAAGGPSTVDSANTAIDRARNSHCDSINGATFAANAFFPYTDAPKALVDAGCSYGVVPEGGQNFADVKKFFLENHTNVFFLPPVIRGFNRH
ncbi:MAG: hypothetical protein HY537_01480, partial [Deltaproteobacteria bacterium]|nr:hypothetical protein [Deltaproteobacteria bacterium]